MLSPFFIRRFRRLRPWMMPGAFATTPTSMINRMMGLEAFTDALSLPAGTTVAGTPVDAGSRVVAVPATTTTLTLTAAAHAGRLIGIASTGGLAITPPAATGTLNTYNLYVTSTISGGSFTIDAKAGNASDIFAGIAFQNKTGTGLTTTPTAATTNLLTFNGTTTGGIIGDRIELVDVGLHTWWLFIIGQYTGTFGTPFSNH